MFQCIYLFFLIFATKNPSYKSVGFTHKVPGIFVESIGSSSIPLKFIGAISAFPPFMAVETTS